MAKARSKDYLYEWRANGPIEHERGCAYVVSSSMSCTCGAVARWVAMNADSDEPDDGIR